MNNNEHVRLRIAMIGTRGVPANYGGFETCVEEIGKRLVNKGHDVTVYCRNSYYQKRYEKYLGMKLVYLPNLKRKSLDTMSHSIISALHALFQKYDIYMVFNAANSPFLILLRLYGKNIIVNTDGIEWKRSKWGFFGRNYYRMCERLSCAISNRLVSDSKGIRKYYKKRYNADSTEIAYGAYIQNCKMPKMLKEMGLEPKQYFLQITRFEPENKPLLTLRAFKKLSTKKKLVLVGGNPYPNEYTRTIDWEATKNVILPGFIYDQDLLKELWCNCYAYIHGNSVGGTNPALLQSMASGCFTIASDVIFNRDVLSDCGEYYKSSEDELACKMQWALDNEAKLDFYRMNAQNRIVKKYNWERITEQYEQLFCELYNSKSQK